MKKDKVVLLNIISNFILQFVTILSGFIMPKLILNNFGSEVNGLVSSVGQFLNYISLLEGGISGVIMAAFYKPLFNKDNSKISSILNTTKHFFRKIAYIFIIYSLIVAFVYPLIAKTSFSYIYLITLVLIMSFGLFMQYHFSLALKLLLNADKKVYIVSFTQSIIFVLNIFLAIVSLYIYPSIHVIKMISALLYIVQPIVFNHFIKKYFIIDSSLKEDNSLIKQRWDGFAINIAYFIHANTDVFLLTVLSDIKLVSVYSIYKLVVNGLTQTIKSITSAIMPNIGHLYAKGNIEELNEKFNTYEFFNFFAVGFLFTVAGLLITPFVMIYTKNITDINYYEPLFGIVLVVAELMYVLKSPHLSLAYSANMFKKMKIPAYLEAVINIAVSIVLINYLGLLGIAIGTLVAMTYRTIYQVYFLKNHILNRKLSIFLKKFIVFGVSSLVGICISLYLIPTVDYSIFSWIIAGITYSLIILLIYFISSMIFYKKEILYLKNYLLKK
ncbi:MAG: virulence factor MviN [Clostridia bacterium]|nr:virulence factor MviN [Clostridia bacterium]